MAAQEAPCSLVVTTTADSGAGSLRSAIECANGLPGHDTIRFAIPGPGPHIIALTRQLPDLTEAVVIDGFSQPGSRPNTLTNTATDASVQVEIRGNRGINLAFFVRGGNSIIQGLAFNSFRHTAMWVASDDNLIRGNFIGTDASGLLALPNGHTGILLNDFRRNQIGGKTADARNLISGNVGAGICLKSELPSRSSDNVIQGNVIGLGADGSPLPNDAGIQLDEADNTLVGGFGQGEMNFISGNRGAGVVVYGSGSAFIQGNALYGNGGLGIDLVPRGGSQWGDGVTLNDPGDRDAGPNGLQNFPTLTSAVTGISSTRVEGSISSGPSWGLFVDLYANEVCNASGHGEGKRFLKRVPVVTLVNGIGSFEADIVPPLPEGSVVTATATFPPAGTSEFSTCQSVTLDPAHSKGDLVLGLTATPEPVQVGTPLKYNLSITNPGPGSVSNIRLEDILPSGVSVVSVKSDRGECTVNNGVVTCLLGTLNAGEIANLEIVVLPEVPGVIVNTPQVTGTTGGEEITRTARVTSTVVDLPVLTIDDVEVSEASGAQAVFRLTLSSPAASAVTLRVQTADQSATAGADYESIPATTVRIEAGQTQVTVPVRILDDSIYEGPEEFRLELSGIVGGRLARASAVGRILDGESLPTLSVNDITVTEGPGAEAVFEILLSGASSTPVTVQVSTQDGTALSPDDYQVFTGTLTFPPSTLLQTVRVPITNDTIHEDREKFYLNLSQPTGGRLGKFLGIADIVDDDPESPIAQLGLGVVGAPDPVTVGTPVVFTLSLTNLGPGVVNSARMVSALPPGLTNLVIQSDRGQCVLNGTRVECDFGSLTNGEVLQVIIRGNPGSTGVYTNQVSATGLSQGQNIQAAAQAVITAVESIVLTVDDVTVPEGPNSRAVFRLVLSRPAVQAISVKVRTITETAIGGEDYQPLLSTVNFAVGSTEQTVSVRILEDTLSEVTEFFRLDLTEPVNVVLDRDKAYGYITDNDVEPARLALGMEASPNPVLVGQPLTYTLLLTNLGPGSVNAARLVDNLPAGLSNVVIRTDRGTCVLTNGVMTCDFGTLTNGETVRVEIVAIPTVPGEIVNRATAQGTSRGVPVSVGAEVATIVLPLSGKVADLGVKITAPLESVDGQPLPFTVTITNAGPDAVGPFFVTNTLPPGTTLISALPNGTTGSCFVTNDLVVICALDGIPAGGSVSVDYVIEPAGPGPLALNVTVAPGAGVTDPNLGNNSASSTVNVTAPVKVADLGVKITAPLESVDGQPLPFTVTITNAGPDAVGPFFVTNTLPPGTTLISALPNGTTGSCFVTNDLVVICALDGIPAGGSVSVDYVIEPAGPGTLAMSVSVAPGEGVTDPDYRNNQAAAQTLVREQQNPELESDLAVSLLAPEAVTLGRNVNVTATVTNLGPDAVAQLVITNFIPPGVTLISSTVRGGAGNCEVTNSMVVCMLGGLGVGQSASVDYVFAPQAAGDVAWRVVAAPVGALDRSLGNNEALAMTQVQSDGTDIDEVKVFFTSPMRVNRQSGYYEQTLVVTNTGTTSKSRLAVRFGNLPQGAVVANAAGSLTNNGVVNYYMLVSGSVQPGGSVRFLAEYHNIPRASAIPQITVEAFFLDNNVVLPELPDPSLTGVRVELTRTLKVGSVQGLDRAFFLIEFPSVPGRNYVVQYSDDGGGTWRTSLPLVTPPANRYQWIDDGPPKTASLPSDTSARLYRVFQLP